MKKDKEKLTEEQKEEKQARTNKILANIFIISIILAIIWFGISCCIPKSSNKSWEKDANSIGYEKKSDGQWYYVGDVSDILMK